MLIVAVTYGFFSNGDNTEPVVNNVKKTSNTQPAQKVSNDQEPHTGFGPQREERFLLLDFLLEKTLFLRHLFKLHVI